MWRTSIYKADYKDHVTETYLDPSMCMYHFYRCRSTSMYTGYPFAQTATSSHLSVSFYHLIQKERLNS